MGCSVFPLLAYICRILRLIKVFKGIAFRLLGQQVYELNKDHTREPASKGVHSRILLAHPKQPSIKGR